MLYLSNKELQVKVYKKDEPHDPLQRLQTLKVRECTSNKLLEDDSDPATVLLWSPWVGIFLE